MCTMNVPKFSGASVDRQTRRNAFVKNILNMTSTSRDVVNVIEAMSYVNEYQQSYILRKTTSTSRNVLNVSEDTQSFTGC